MSKQGFALVARELEDYRQVQFNWVDIDRDEVQRLFGCVRDVHIYPVTASQRKWFIENFVVEINLNDYDYFIEYRYEGSNF